MAEEKKISEYKETFTLIADSLIRNNPKAVNRGNFEEGYKTLGDSIFPNNQLPFDFKDLQAVGPEFVAGWIVNSWSSLDTSTKSAFIDCIIQQLSGKITHRFYLHLCSLLVSEDKESAIRLYGKVCVKEGLTSDDLKSNIAFCDVIRKVLITTKKDVVFTTLPLHKETEGVREIVINSLAAVFLDIKGKAVGIREKFQVIKWIGDARLQIEIPEVLQSAIKKSILVDKSNIPLVQGYLTGFPEKVEFVQEKRDTLKEQENTIEKREIKNGQARLQSDTIAIDHPPSVAPGTGGRAEEVKNNTLLKESKPVEQLPTADGNTMEGKIRNYKKESSGVGLLDQAGTSAKPLGGDKLNSDKGIRRYADRPGTKISHSEKDSTGCQKQPRTKTFRLFEAVDEIRSHLNELETKNRNNESEIEKHVAENKKLSNVLQEVGNKKDGEIAQLKSKILSTQNDASGLRAELRKLTEEKELLKNNRNEVIRQNNELIVSMEEKERFCQEELVRFSSKIDPLSDQKIIEFKNRLKESLRPDHGLLEEIKQIEMTINVGNNLRALMFKIFNKLTDEGISF